MFGQYNCFLNVVIQSLWHLPAFRTALLSLPNALPDNGASPKDAAVLRALHNIFTAFSKTPPDSQQQAARGDAEVQSASADSAAAQQLQQQEEADTAASSATTEADAVVRQSISPDELREALSNLEKGQSPVEFELSEMHDAAEVRLVSQNYLPLHKTQLRLYMLHPLICVAGSSLHVCCPNLMLPPQSTTQAAAACNRAPAEAIAAGSLKSASPCNSFDHALKWYSMALNIAQLQAQKDSSMLQILSTWHHTDMSRPSCCNMKHIIVLIQVTDNGKPRGQIMLI